MIFENVFSGTFFSFYRGNLEKDASEWEYALKTTGRIITHKWKSRVKEKSKVLDKSIYKLITEPFRTKYLHSRHKIGEKFS